MRLYRYLEFVFVALLLIGISISIDSSVSVSALPSASQNGGTATTTTPSIAVQVSNTLLSVLADALTTAPSGYSAVIDTNTAFIQFATVGLPINPKSFSDTEGFINPSLNLNQAAQFASLVNSNQLTISNIEQAYWNIVNASVASPDIDTNSSARWKDAFWFLYVNQSNFDTFNNVTTYTLMPSETYAYYLTCLSAYNNAVKAYRTAQTSLSSLQWYVAQPGLMGQLQIASNNLQSVAPVIEDALNALNSLGTSLSATTISQARQMLSPLVGSDTALNLVPNGFYPVFPQPPDWGTNTGDYTNIAISNSNVQTTLSSSYSSWSAGGGFGGGFFSWGASWSASGGSSSQHYNVETTTLSVTASYALVELQRPWLLDSLFTIGGWSLSGYSSGSISQGTAAGIRTGLLPCYPTHMIVAQNVSITGLWTANDSAALNSWLSGGGSIGFGPFAVSGGNYAFNNGNGSSEPFNATVFNNTIQPSGAQIIGWVQKIVPFAPQLNGGPTTATTTTTTTSTTQTQTQTQTTTVTGTSASTSTATSTATATTTATPTTTTATTTATATTTTTTAVNTNANTNATTTVTATPTHSTTFATSGSAPAVTWKPSGAHQLMLCALLVVAVTVAAALPAAMHTEVNGFQWIE